MAVTNTTDTPDNKPDFVKAAREVTLIGAALDALLGLAKILVGSIANSYSLVADGVHSLSDLASDFMVLAITRFSRSSPDSDHPYGHARFETLATVLLGCMLLAVAVALAYENILRFLDTESLPIPTWPALIIALISIASKEWIYRYTANVAKEYKSDLLLANAWHSRSDALSSIVVFIGVLGSMLGVVWMDVLAALVVAAIIAKIAIGFILQNLRQLVDEGLSVPEQKQIIALAKEVEGVVNVHDLRSRLMGSDAYIEIHIEVDAWISVSEGHYIGNCVCKKIRKHMPDVTDIVFHIDIEHKEHDSFTELPTRNEIIAILESAIPKLAAIAQLEKTTLHYVNKKVFIELFMPTADENTLTECTNKATALCKQHKWLQDISILKRIPYTN